MSKYLSPKRLADLLGIPAFPCQDGCVNCSEILLVANAAADHALKDLAEKCGPKISLESVMQQKLVKHYNDAGCGEVE